MNIKARLELTLILSYIIGLSMLTPVSILLFGFNIEWIIFMMVMFFICMLLIYYLCLQLIKPPNVPWIKNGVCTNNGEFICNLGYACDGCPYEKP